MSRPSPDYSPPLPQAAKRWAALPENVWKDRRVIAEAKELLGLLVLRAYPDWECWPSRSELAADLGISRAAVTLRIHMLEKADYVRVEPHAGRRNHYFIQPAARWKDEAPQRLPNPRSVESVRAECRSVDVRFKDEYVARGKGHPGVDPEAWRTARAMKRQGATREELEAYLDSNLAGQRGDATGAAAARRHAS